MEINQTLVKLLNVDSVSGTEPEKNCVIKDVIAPYCDEVREDKLGNVIGLKKGLRRDINIMLAAHMDEIGLMVKHIDDNGFIKFAFIGGVDNRILPAQQVVIHGKERVIGIIGNRPPHIQKPEERKKAIKADDMFIDTGLPAKTVKSLVSVGDFISFEKKPMELYNSSFSSGALDDRAGIAAILYALEELNRLKFDSDVYAVATVQEEVGLRGAMVSSFNIYPHIGIAVDVCHGRTPEVPEDETQELGKGPVLAIGPNIHPKLFAKLKEVAQENDIPYQLNPEPAATGTDAWAIQIAREGIPTALISIPLRYMHTTVETLCLEDIKKAGKLLALFISTINKSYMEGLMCY